MGEAAAIKGGKSALARLEQRVRELEAELGGLQGRTGEMMKGNQRAERKVKELQFAQDEDKKNQDRMSELANKLGQDQDVQAADRGGRGDRRPQPGQVPQGPARVGGNLRARCPCRDVRSSVNIYLKKEFQLTVFAANYNPRMAVQCFQP